MSLSFSLWCLLEVWKCVPSLCLNGALKRGITMVVHELVKNVEHMKNIVFMTNQMRYSCDLCKKRANRLLKGFLKNPTCSHPSSLHTDVQSCAVLSGNGDWHATRCLTSVANALRLPFSLSSWCGHACGQYCFELSLVKKHGECLVKCGFRKTLVTFSWLEANKPICLGLGNEQWRLVHNGTLTLVSWRKSHV